MESNKGRIFKVTYEGELVWEYIIPFYAPAQSGQGTFNLGRNNFTHRFYRYPYNIEGFKDKDMNPNHMKALNDLYDPDAFDY